VKDIPGYLVDTSKESPCHFDVVSDLTQIQKKIAQVAPLGIAWARAFWEKNTLPEYV
jgi:hypothetical protein